MPKIVKENYFRAHKTWALQSKLFGMLRFWRISPTPHARVANALRAKHVTLAANVALTSRQENLPRQ